MSNGQNPISVRREAGTTIVRWGKLEIPLPKLAWYVAAGVLVVVGSAVGSSWAWIQWIKPAFFADVVELDVEYALQLEELAKHQAELPSVEQIVREENGEQTLYRHFVSDGCDYLARSGSLGLKSWRFLIDLDRLEPPPEPRIGLIGVDVGGEVYASQRGSQEATCHTPEDEWDCIDNHPGKPVVLIGEDRGDWAQELRLYRHNKGGRVFCLQWQWRHEATGSYAPTVHHDCCASKRYHR